MESLVKCQIITVIIILVVTSAICLIHLENPKLATEIHAETRIASYAVVGIVLFLPLFVSLFALAATGGYYGGLALIIIAAIGYGAHLVITASAFWGAIIAAVMGNILSIIISMLLGDELDLTSPTPVGIVSLPVASVANFGILYGLPSFM